MKKGYSLIELLVTVGVFSILLGIGTIGFTSIRARDQTDLAAAEIRAELMQVRTEAINHIDSGVYFEANRYVYFLGTSYTEGAPGNEETSLPSSMSLSDISLVDSIARFDPVTGYLIGYSDPSGVTVQGQADAHTVSINQWGAIEIE